MSISIDDATFSTLTAQPFGYEETETRSGLTAQKWTISGLLDPAEWLALLDAYDAWRDLRIDDPDTATFGSIGTTISFSGTGPGGQTWIDIDCWFVAAPQGEQSGNRINASVELVDAAQALQVILKQQEISELSDELDIGTITIGDVTLKLIKPPESYNQGPGAQLTAAGNHYITGPLVVEEVLDVEGYTNADGWDDIRTWYEAAIIATPASGTYFPISAPSATARNKVVGGVKTVEYTVSIQLLKVI
jgi:hypothetical protein